MVCFLMDYIIQPQLMHHSPLSNINIALLSVFGLHFPGIFILFPFFLSFLSHFVLNSIYLELVFARSMSLCLLIETIKPFTLNVITCLTSLLSSYFILSFFMFPCYFLYQFLILAILFQIFLLILKLNKAFLVSYSSTLFLKNVFSIQCLSAQNESFSTSSLFGFLELSDFLDPDYHH